MFESWKHHISSSPELNKSAKYLVALSGGVDSVVLVDLFDRSGFCFALAHCNFMLRAEESDGDESFVKELGQKYKAEVHTKTFATQKYADSNGVSIQMAARDLRYQWFEELMSSKEFDYLVTAHHANDNVETTLFNLVKGTGISGLRGIRPVRGTLLRPLLPFKKDSLIVYANERKLSWREDSSNESHKYTRNLIRHEVIPVLKTINPDIESTMQDMFEKMTAIEQIFKKHVEHLGEKVTKTKGSLIYLNKEGLQNESAPVLFQLLEPYGFNYAQSKSILAALDSTSGKRFYSDSHQLVMDRENIILDDKNGEYTVDVEILEGDTEIMLPVGVFNMSRFNSKNYKIPTSASVAALDIAKINFPLQLRSWQQGDWFVPLGMNGKKKLSDFMIDEKIPLNLKRRLLVLSSGNSILWVVGHRIDDRFKISEETREVIEIKHTTSNG